MEVTYGETCNGQKKEGTGSGATRAAALAAALRDCAEKLTAGGCETAAAECIELADQIENL